MGDRYHGIPWRNSCPRGYPGTRVQLYPGHVPWYAYWLLEVARVPTQYPGARVPLRAAAVSGIAMPGYPGYLGRNS
eukprot:1679650-Rhodomonas_salina.1